MSNPEVRITRRRYGRHTYTWAEIKLKDEWISLGDPWPSVRIPRHELEHAIGNAITKHLLKETTHGRP